MSVGKEGMATTEVLMNGIGESNNHNDGRNGAEGQNASSSSSTSARGNCGLVSFTFSLLLGSLRFAECDLGF